MTAYPRRDALIVCSTLLLLAAWDLAGFDLPLMRSLGNSAGFMWREAPALTGLHKGGRILGWLVLGWMAWTAWIASRQPRQADCPDRAENRNLSGYWLGITLLCLLTINVIKQVSATSCPWDLAEFGGVARHISHWALLTPDGGPGQCFPSGHSSAGFAFFSLYFLHRQHHARRARGFLLAVCAAGVVFSLTQIARGAHYPSHALWTAWLCWTVCCLADSWLMRKQALQLAAGQA